MHLPQLSIAMTFSADNSIRLRLVLHLLRAFFGFLSGPVSSFLGGFLYFVACCFGCFLGGVAGVFGSLLGGLSRIFHVLFCGLVLLR